MGVNETTLRLCNPTVFDQSKAGQKPVLTQSEVSPFQFLNWCEEAIT